MNNIIQHLRNAYKAIFALASGPIAGALFYIAYKETGNVTEAVTFATVLTSALTGGLVYFKRNEPMQ